MKTMTDAALAATRGLVVAAGMTALLAACTEQPAPRVETGAEAGTEAAAAEKPLASGIDMSTFDENVRPQDNFFAYVNGGWLATTKIPADKSNYGSFNALADEAEANLRAIIEEAAAVDAPAGSDQQKVGDFYESFMDQARADELGIEPVKPYLEAIAATETHEDVLAQMADMFVLGIETPVAGYIGADAKNSTQYALTLWQSGLGMPDRDYYLSDEEKFVKLRAAYVAHIAKMLTMTGHENAQQAAEDILALETRIAENHWTRVQNRDDNATYNKVPVADIDEEIAGFGWAHFLELAGAGSADAVIVSQPSYFKAFADMFRDVPVSTWHDYMAFHTISEFAPLLSSGFVAEDFDFYGKTLRGIEENRPRWKRGVDAVESALGEMVGKLYVERHFSPEAKARMVELVDNLLATFDAAIDDLEWMGPETKKAAHEKLSKFTVKIGYPDKWKDYSALKVVEGDLVGNVIRSREVEHAREIAKLGTPVDKSEWFMTPQTVNAYYNPTTNEIAFPAAILQPPFFNPAADDAVNYGGIGAVIGHEVSHGFDDSGADYDGDGNLRNWWTEKDLVEFNARGEALAAQYDTFSPVEGMHVNGKLTLGENIGDLSGLTIAYQTYRRSLNGEEAPVIDGLTGDQRFFMGWAQVWRRKYREEELINRLKTDPHSPSRYRTNGVVRNMPAFYAAFDVKEGDEMYLAPEKRVKLW